MQKKDVVILGAGYSGLMTAVKLGKMLSSEEASITLVNKNDVHNPTTWLHENAAGTLHYNETRIPIKEIINTNKIKFVTDIVLAIKPEQNKIKMKHTYLNYDILVLALGSEPMNHDIPGLDDNAFTIKNVNNARVLKEHLDYNLAMYHYDNEYRQERLNVVVSAGLTGIEYLGELANRLPELSDEYDIPKAMIRLIGIEEASSILSGYNSIFSDYVMTSLESRGVEFITNAKVEECQSDRIIYEKNGKRSVIPTYTIVWTDEWRGHSIVQKSGFTNQQGKINVMQSMKSKDYPNVFAVGGCACVQDEDRSLPTVQTIIQQSITVAHNIKALVRGYKDLMTYNPRPSKYTVVSLGHTDAVGSTLKHRNLYGWRAVLLKRMRDNFYLFKLGGLKLLLRNGYFNIFA